MTTLANNQEKFQVYHVDTKNIQFELRQSARADLQFPGTLFGTLYFLMKNQ